MSQSTDASPSASKSRTTAALLAMLVGTLGIHQFYLGNRISGIIRIVMTVTIYGALISMPLAIIEAVMYLIASDDKFQEDYVLKRKAWPWQNPSIRTADDTSGTELNKRFVFGIVGIGAIALFIGCVALVSTDFDRANDQIDRALDQNDRALDQIDRMLGE